MMAHQGDNNDMDEPVVVTITNNSKSGSIKSRNKSRRQHRYQQRRNSNNNNDNVQYETLVQQEELDQQSNKSFYKHQQLQLQYRPRIIYFSIFTIYAISNGRFLALFLQNDGKLNNSEIGILYSIKLLISLPLTTYGGYYADSMEKYYPGYGRIYIILIGISFGMILYLLHGISRIFTNIQFFSSIYWFLILQIGMGISLSILSPVLDGLCLDYLKSDYSSLQQPQQSQPSSNNELYIDELDNKSDNGTCQHTNVTTTTTNFDEDKGEPDNDTIDTFFEDENNTNTKTNERNRIINHQQHTSTSTDNNNNNNNNQQQFGKERVFGAYSWAITNVILSLLFDYYSNDPFIVTYPLCILSSMLTIVTIYIYSSTSTTLASSNYNSNNSSYIHLSTNSLDDEESEYDIIYNNNTRQQQKLSNDDDDNEEEYSNNQSILLTCISKNPSKQKIKGTKTYRNGCIHNSKNIVDKSSTSVDDCDTSTFNDDDDDETIHQNDVIISYNDNAKNDGTDKHKNNTIDNLSLPQLLYLVMSSSVLAIPFSIAFVTLSSGQAIVDSLVFLYFKDLGSSYTIMGLTVVLTVIFEIPIFHVAPLLLQKVGSSTLLLIASFCYITRVIGYTFIQRDHIYYLLLLEPFHGITYACSATAAVDYISQIIPNGYEASGQSILYLLKSIGTIVGVFVGGIVQDMYGPIIMYRFAACVVTSGSLIFIVAHFINNRKLMKT